MAKRVPPTFPRSKAVLARLGLRLRAARLRRQMTLAEMAARVNVSIPTLSKVERGDPSTNFATVLRVLGVLGMAGDIEFIAKDDPLGRELQDIALKRPRPKRNPSP